MKNIHILPTEKPSRLYYNGTSYKDPNSTMAMDWFISSAGYKPQNIHITSEEEIKEGDWYLDDNNSIGQSYKLSHVQFANPKKIILTTDFGKQPRVQAIGDEFLEWFVKNPSCEKVDWCYSSLMKDYEYEIIIPKEEVKQETQGYICPQTKKQCDDECCVSAEDCHIEASFDIISDCEDPKQETLEEFIQRQLSLGKYQDQESAIKYSIELGAKWQQERTCKHIYTLTSEQGHRVIKCSKCNDTQPI